MGREADRLEKEEGAQKLSVLILTQNEEEMIEDCIRSVSFADEVLLIDSGSKDRTQEIAESLGAKFISHPMSEEGFAGQRNFALTQTNAAWVLYLDADERMEDGAETEIRACMQKPAAYEFRRETVFIGQRMRHGVYRPDFSLRLYPRECVHWKGVVHEQAETPLQIVRAKALMHHHVIRNWAQYFRKFDQYTTMMAEQMLEKNKKSSGVYSGIAHGICAFFQSYVLKRGFLDGKLGLVLCLNHFFYTMMKYVKLDELRRKRSADRGKE